MSTENYLKPFKTKKTTGEKIKSSRFFIKIIKKSLKKTFLFANIQIYNKFKKHKQEAKKWRKAKSVKNYSKGEKQVYLSTYFLSKKIK